MMAMNMGFIL